MSRRQTIPLTEWTELQLSDPQRSIVLTSRFVTDDSILERIRQAPARGPVMLSFDELADLHRGLAVDTNQTDDSKRRKAIHKILEQIEEWLSEEDEDEEFGKDNEWFGFADGEDELELPSSVEEVFQTLFDCDPGISTVDVDLYSVAFGKPERALLLGMDSIPGDVRKLLSDDSRDEISLSVRQFLVTSLTIKEVLQHTRNKAQRQPLEAIAMQLSAGMFAGLHARGAAEQSVGDHLRQTRRAATKTAFQLKITLDRSKPPIWRRVQVADCTLDELHEVIQTAMGWYGCHLHAFEWNGHVFSDPDAELDGGDYDETQVHLSALIEDGCKKLRYTYDFGDDWQHTIAIEKTFEPKPTDRFPVCLKGVGACPPEDCGGLWGYYDFLNAMRDPKHERHAELVDWAGENFDPAQFEIDQVNADLAK